ncbi:hypothetical protein N826_31365 [Skermanella aerolata KACC 11604]|nr:hypothetical protein N826_31365 [Skermanella aerolata KACC 11604]
MIEASKGEHHDETWHSVVQLAQDLIGTIER